MLDEMAARGVDRSKLTAVPMGVDLESAVPDLIEPARDARLESRRVVVYLGAMERERRIDLLFETLAEVRSAIPNILLVLAGDSQDADHRSRLQSRMAELGVEDLVLWTGWLPTHEAWRYVRAAAVGISPYPRGPLLDSASPTKALEYMALGVPVLANDQPDQAQVILASGAGVCTSLHPATFADALKQMLSSPANLAEWGARGRPYVARHRSYAVIGERLAAVYRRLDAERLEKGYAS
jgi:glycosyltransferase involved in cell wall biosynthesis